MGWSGASRNRDGSSLAVLRPPCRPPAPHVTPPWYQHTRLPNAYPPSVPAYAYPHTLHKYQHFLHQYQPMRTSIPSVCPVSTSRSPLSTVAPSVPRTWRSRGVGQYRSSPRSCSATAVSGDTLPPTSARFSSCTHPLSTAHRVAQYTVSTTRLEPGIIKSVRGIGRGYICIYSAHLVDFVAERRPGHISFPAGTNAPYAASVPGIA
eukprot:2075794-Rhodomonas_salina.4